MIDVREYIDRNGRSEFQQWFRKLKTPAALKVNTYLTRISNGNFSNVKGVGKGVHECVIDWGPGYRVYFGKDGDKLVILLGGGTKKRQSADIQKAIANWTEYKKRKKEE